jgi:bacterioferritin
MLTLNRREQMRGNEKVIAQLNAALSSELTAIVQYMTQSEMCQNWGYKRLGQRTKARAIEEMKHAEGLIERVIFLDEVPSVDVALKPQLGRNVQQQLEVNLKDEHDAVRQYNQAVKVCVEAGDEGSRVLFEQMIKDEERHVDYLEAQLHSIEEMGIANYLAEQLHE